VTPDGRKVYVTNEAGNINTMAAIDTSTNTVSPIQVGYDPWGIAVTADGNKVYVVNGLSNSVTVIDSATNTVSATISGFNSSMAFGVFIQPAKSVPRFAGTLGKANCFGRSVPALAR
jgi:YVTN family beta-propeller protein